MNLKIYLISFALVLAGITQGQVQKHSIQTQDQTIGLKPEKPSTSISRQVDIVASADNGYVPDATHNIYFSFSVVNADFEYVDSVSMTFPDGVIINSVSNDEIFGPSFDPGGAPEAYNGIADQTVSWGDNDNDYGGITAPGDYNFTINCTFDAALSGDFDIEVHASGDEFGADPGDQDFTITVSQADNPTSRIQIIHNSPDLDADVVDIRVNGDFPNGEFNNLPFRTATPFVVVPAGAELNITINPSDSGDDMSPLYQEVITFDPGIDYSVVANGMVNAAGYDDFVEFSLDVFPQARELALDNETVDVLVHHGSPGADTVNVFEPFLNALLVQGLAYSEFSGYRTLPNGDYGLQILSQDGSEVLQTVNAPLGTIGLGGSAITVVASGFVDPASNNNGAEFGLWFALPEGGELLELIPIDLARMQVIHNSADLAAEQVDIRINGELPPFFDNFTFRTSTPYLNFLANDPLLITVHPSDSEDDSNPLFTLDLDQGLDAEGVYQVIAEGILSDEGYSPSSAETPFNLNVVLTARTTADAEGNVDVLVSHGSTDAPTVDVNEITLPQDELIDDISFGEIQGYAELATADYGLEIADAGSGDPIAAYAANLESLGLNNSAITVLASGFVVPGDNSGGASFGLWVALPSGGPLVELPSFVINNTPCDFVTIDVDGASVFGNNSGATVEEGEVAPPNDALDCTTPGTWCDGGAEPLGQLNNTTWFQFTAPSSGGVEISACNPGTNFDTQLALWSAEDCTDYGTFELIGANDDFDTEQFECAADNNFASVFRVCGLTGGEDYFIQLDGYLGSTGDYELSVSALEETQCQARLQVVHNSADAAASVVDVRVNGAFPAGDYDDLPFRTATATINAPAGVPLDITINASTSIDDSDPILLLEGVVLDLEGSYQVIAQGIASGLGYEPGSDEAPLELILIDGYIESNPNPGETFLAVVHGSTDAPAVDIDELWINDETLVGNIAYGGVDGYLNIPAVDYQIGVTEAGQDEIIAAYGAPLSALGGEAITVFASGFLDPTVNSDGAGFGLWYSTSAGGPLIPLEVVTSVEELIALNSLSVFPNPTSQNLNLEFELTASNPVAIEIYSTTGQLVKARELGTRSIGFNREQINLGDLAAGLYILNIQVGNERINRRVQVLK